jgi:AraC family transcriptional regulator of adaptative response / DNA-3-methyladenine glycosylase II
VEQYRVVVNRDKRYDGVFYLAVKTTRIYCRPSCFKPPLALADCVFFDTIRGGQAPRLSSLQDLLSRQDKKWPVGRNTGLYIHGAIDDNGVCGLADSLHISVRHLRRLVQDRTGSSPLHLNNEKRLHAARQLILQTKLPIVVIAFDVGFSSPRQFNAVFRDTFHVSPQEMRKHTLLLSKERPGNSIALLLALSYESIILQTRLRH